MIFITKAGFFRLFLFITALFISGCGESPQQVENKLHRLCQDDLRYMVAEVLHHSNKNNVLDKPFYTIMDYKLYDGDSARHIRAYAQVRFELYRGVNVVQERKYRYFTTTRAWDRFEKKLKHK